MDERFKDRAEAGRALAQRLMEYVDRPDVEVLALPRGGVPVAYAIAEAIAAPLDVFIVRKLGVPGQQELAMGAIATGDVRILNESVIRQLEISDSVVEQVTQEQRAELHRREREYRGGHGPVRVHGRVVILVDDGLATGATMLAAIEAIRRLGPARIVVAAPIASRDACDAVRKAADQFVCIYVPEPFDAVSSYYDEFPQVSDSEARLLLEQGRILGCCGSTDPAAGIHEAAPPRLEPHAILRPF